MRIRKLLAVLSMILFCSCTTEKTTPENKIVVIGGGLMGSSSAWQLSFNDAPVLLLEKQDSIYENGSSYGEARIARSNNRNNDIWSYLHNCSITEISRLIDFLNSDQEEKSYAMEDIYTTSPVTYLGRTRIYDKLYASLKRQDVKYDMAVTPDEGAAKYGISLPDSVLCQREYNKHSGMINPKVLINYLHRAIKKKGNTIRYNTQVISISYNNSSALYEIAVVDKKTGAAEVVFADKVVSAAGPYTGKLLKSVSPQFEKLIDPQRVFLSFLKIKEEKYASFNNAEKDKLKNFYPVINSSEGTRMGSAFSMIEYYNENNNPIIKIGGHFQRSPIDKLDEVWKIGLAMSEIDWSKNKTLEYLKILNLPIEMEDIALVNGYSCVYSLTHNEVPYITPIPNEENLPNNDFIVMGGLSGVGAKGAMAYGLIASDLIYERAQKDSMYIVAKKALGFERLLEDIEDL